MYSDSTPQKAKDSGKNLPTPFFDGSDIPQIYPKRSNGPKTRQKQYLLDLHNEIIVDLFAGGGGMSTSFEMVLGRSPDVAVNHNEQAISMHQANHPQTEHYISDVYEVCPHVATKGRPVGWLHLSPDCRHHSQAAGGQPRNKQLRGLSWVGARWAGQVKPRVISLENVPQILKWGPLIAKRCKETGRVVRIDGTVANKGERVPVQEQFLIPDPKREGASWRKFIATLKSMGYELEVDVSVAADLGGHTTRKRLFMIARRDGAPIVMPAPTHAKGSHQSLKRHKPAANCIDWSIQSKSIFERERPLAEATLRRIALGIKKFVFESDNPYVVDQDKNGGAGISTPVIAKFRGTSPGSSITDAMPTITSGGDSARPAGAPHALGLIEPVFVGVPYLAQMNGGFNETLGRPLQDAMTTVTSSGSQQQLVTAHLAILRRHSIGHGADEALAAVTAGAQHHALVTSTFVDHQKEDGSGIGWCVKDALSEDQYTKATQAASLLMRHYDATLINSGVIGSARVLWQENGEAIIVVGIRGVLRVLVDISLRMLVPAELYRAQDFPEHYIIDRGHDGRKFARHEQVRMVGNSVDPVHAAAYLRLNAHGLAVQKMAA